MHGAAIVVTGKATSARKLHGPQKQHRLHSCVVSLNCAWVSSHQSSFSNIDAAAQCCAQPQKVQLQLLLAGRQLRGCKLTSAS
jgi:hypothetical protein